jgi:hypothetical protein
MLVVQTMCVLASPFSLLTDMRVSLNIVTGCPPTSGALASITKSRNIMALLLYIYIYIISITNCNWAYGRWHCLQRPYIQQGNSTSHKNRIIHRTNFQSTKHKYNISTWTLQNKSEHRKYRIQKIQKKTKWIYCPGNEPGPSSPSLHSLRYPDPVCNTTILRFTTEAVKLILTC